MAFLSHDQIRRQVPSVFTQYAAPTVSNKYVYLSTDRVIDRFEELGFKVSGAREGTKRNPDGQAFAMHEVRMTTGDVDKSTAPLGTLIPEVIIRNSHDRTSGLNLRAGLYRLVCNNGMTVAQEGFSFSVRHIGRGQAEKLQAAIDGVRERLPRTLEIASNWNKLELTYDQVTDFARRAIALRGTSMEIAPAALLRPNRYLEKDLPSTLWNVFNRVQENVTIGGMQGRTEAGRFRRVAGISSLAADVDWNNKLWALAATYAKEVRPVSVVVD